MVKKMRNSQNQKILKYMKEHGQITPMDALKQFGCMRLAARVKELRNKGYNIESTTITNVREGKNVSYSSYYLRNDE